jgi:hypothetical protein
MMPQVQTHRITESNASPLCVGLYIRTCDDELGLPCSWEDHILIIARQNPKDTWVLCGEQMLRSNGVRGVVQLGRRQWSPQ